MHGFSKYNRARFNTCAKIISAFAICLALALSCYVLADYSTAFAESAPSEQALSDDLQSRIPIKAGVFGFEGYHMKDETTKELSGYGIEFLNLVAEYSRLNFQFVGYDRSWKQTQQDLIDGVIDIATSARRTTEREVDFDFSLPIGRNKTVLSMRFDNNTIRRGVYSTYNGMKIGLVEGSTQNDSLDEFAAEKKFEYTTETYPDDVELVAALRKGDIDAILSSNLRKADNEKELDVIAEADFYAIVRKGDTQLLEEINYAIEQMNIYEGDWKNVLFYKYYGTDYSDADAFNDRELEYIADVQAGRKRITATAAYDRAPYSYVKDNALVGIIPNYFAEVMRIAELPYTLMVPSDSKQYQEFLNASNSPNVVLDSLETYTAVENDVYHGFDTESYLTATMARVTRHDFDGTLGTVAVVKTQSRELIEQNLPEYATTVGYDTAEEAIDAVMKKKADAAYVYSYAAQFYVNRDHTNSLYYTMLNGLSATFSIHIKEGTDHELITIINKCIKRISEDTLNQIATDYISSAVNDISFWQYIQVHPEIVIVFAVAIAAVICVILVLYLRGRWSKKLLHTTEESNKKMGEQLSIVEALSRDYTNVYSINLEKNTAKVIKLEGYVAEGLKKDSVEEYEYSSILAPYINTRVHPDDRQELTEALSLEKVKEKLSENDSYSGSYRILSGSETHHFQYTYLKIEGDASGHDGFILVGFRNIDEVIRKEQEQKDVLAEALAQAQYANKAKTTFLNNMSHDIRTPMNAIIGFTSLAATHLDNEEQLKSYLSKIMTSGNHLLSLINDVLDMSRIESGKVKIEEKETSLPDIMHDLKTIVQADVKSKQLEFYIDTLDVANEIIICDKLRLNQVLLNLLSNAMKYTRPGGMVSVRVIQTGEATDGHATYEFHVKDTGIGMSKEFLKHVFEPFEREQTSTVSGIQGTGLGLAITKNIVDIMGGTITVESEKDKGSEFVVTFRFKVAGVTVESPRLEQLVDLRALVVDDDVNTCVSVSKMLSTIGMHPDWTTLGNEAIIRTQFALDQNEPYSAYIIDWLMPDMNGIELVRRIRRIIGDTTPVIILTAYDWSDIEKEAREAGVTAFVSKPLFLSELRSVLAAPYLKKEEKPAEEEQELRFDGKKILLVEDNELNMEIAQTLLEGVGFIIDTADDGSVAVEKVKQAPAGTYDLILMDVQMPIMNGYEATRAIRALRSKKKANIPIVAMTANAFEEDKKEAIESGMNGYAAKPIDIPKLMQTLQDILK